MTTNVVDASAYMVDTLVVDISAPVDSTLIGGSGGDLILGGDGNDSLSGEDGNDNMFGESGVDIITDFNLSEGGDLDIAELLIGYDQATSDINDFVKLTTTGGNTDIAVDADGSGSDFSPVAQLENTLTDLDSLVAGGNINPGV